MIGFFDHTGTINPYEMLKSLGATEDKLNDISEFESQLSPKESVFEYIYKFFSEVNTPEKTLLEPIEWQPLGEILFWANHIKVKLNIPYIQVSNIKSAFVELDLDSLSNLMLGANHYGEAIGKQINQFSETFISRFREQYKIFKLNFEEGGVTIHFVTPIVLREKEREQLQKYEVHPHTINIINLARNAFSYVDFVATKGIGHNQTIVPLNDASIKRIGIKNLPLPQLVKINASIIQLYDNTYVPKDWIEFTGRLLTWEEGLAKKIVDTAAILKLNSSQSENFQDIGNYYSQYFDKNIFTELKMPQAVKKPQVKFLNINKSEKIIDRHKGFMDVYRDFFSGMDNFFNQLLSIIHVQLIAVLDKKNPNIDPHVSHVSKMNLHNAIKVYPAYLEARNQLFNKYFSNNNESLNIYNYLFILSFSWKYYLDNNFNEKDLVKTAHLKIQKLKHDVENNLNLQCRKHSQNGRYTLKYQNNDKTGNLPVIFVEGKLPSEIYPGLKKAYELVKGVFGQPEYSSPKQLILDIYFEKVYVVLLFNKYNLNNQWNVFSNHLLRDQEFETLSFANLVPRNIPENILINIGRGNITDIIPLLKDDFDTIVLLYELSLIVEHLSEITLTDVLELDYVGNQILASPFKVYEPQIQVLMNKLLLYLNGIGKQFDEIDSPLWFALNEGVLEIEDKLNPFVLDDESKITIDDIGFVSWASSLADCRIDWSIMLQIVFELRLLRYYTALNKAT